MLSAPDPPTFNMLHRKKLARDLFFHFDWIGLALYSGGLAVFIFGLNWGGVLYVFVDIDHRPNADEVLVTLGLPPT